jgi:Uma2 family endonuclease
MPKALVHPPRTMLEIWESLPEGTLCQLINDKLVISPSPVFLHQQVLNEVNIAFSNFLSNRTLGKLIISPFDVHFSKQNILQPDLVFINNENLNKIVNNYLYGAPDLVIEVLSPSTSHLDYYDKKIIYERYGVQEYFIVEPNSKSVSSYFLKNNEYTEQENQKGKIISVLLNTEIDF